MSLPSREKDQCNDESFGPSVRGCRGDFDFTIAFEQIVFTIVPSTLFLSIGLWRTVWLCRQPKLIDGRKLQVAKQILIATLVVLKLAILILVSLHSNKLQNLPAAANALAFLAILLCGPLSWLEHARSLRPSILLNSYLLLTLLLEVAKARTFLLESLRSTVARIFAAGVCIRVLIIVFESLSKRHWLRSDSKTRCLEESAGIFGLSSFSWLNPLLLRGGRGILRGEDLASIPQDMSAAQIKSDFWDTFHKKTASGRYRLAIAIFKALKWNLLAPILPRLAQIGFTFGQPFLIQGVQSYLLLPSSQANKNAGYGWIGATILIYAGIAVSTAIYSYLNQRAVVIIRGYLVTSIFKQTLKLKTSSSATLTLMSSDVERIRMTSIFIHDYWANVIELALAAWLLQGKLGLAFLVPIGLVMIGFCGTLVMGKYAKPRQAVWMQATQERVRSTANVIAGLKLIKMLGIVPTSTESIEEMRSKELEASSRFRNILVLSASNSFIFPFIMPVLTFAASFHRLTASNMFVSLSYMLLFGQPLTYVLQMIPQLMAAVACLERIATFLELDVRADKRKFGHAQYAESKLSKDDEKGVEIVTTQDISSELSIANKVESTGTNGTAVISIRKGCFGWTDKPLLNNLDVNIPQSGITMVIGPVGSGKSTLCSALLGEVPYIQGEITFSLPDSRIAFCSQTPFLPNVALRDAILGYSDIDEEFYHIVLRACALEPDLDQLTDGDRTLIGSNGAALSGGQRIRVALARAVYARASIVVLDDILSGLDRRTGETLFTNLCGRDGLLRSQKSTVVLCTHDLRFLQFATHIIALNAAGQVEKQGAPSELSDYTEGFVSELVNSRSNEAKPVSDPRKPPQKSEVTDPDADDRNRQLGDIGIYKYYFAMFGRAMLAFIVVLVVILGFLHNFSTIILKFWSDSLLGIAGKHQHGGGYWLGIYAFDQCLAFFLLYVYVRLTFNYLAIKTGHVLHYNALITLMNAPLAFITSTDTGKTLNRFSQDLSVVDMELASALANLCFVAMVTIGQAAVIATSSPYIAAGYPFLLAVLYAIQWFYLRTSRQLRFLDLEMKSPLYTQFLDAAAGLTTIRAFGWTSKFLSRGYELLDSSQRPVYLLAMIQQWLTTVLNLTVAAIATVLVALATQLHSSAGFTSVGLISLMAFGQSLTQIVQFWTQVETSIGAVSRLKRFNENVTGEDDGDDDDNGDDVVIGGDWPSGGAIEIRNVSAVYGEKRTDDYDEKNDEPPHYALNGISLSVAAGEKIAICGRTGSGKSSIINLLLRLLDPITSPATSITIDGIPLSRIPRSTLRERIICVSQDAYFFPDGVSVAQNLDPYGAADADQCNDVLKLVGLQNALPPSPEAAMTAESLSQGQKQLFSLARAVLRRRCRRKGGVGGGGLLLLDEFTASVDRDTERVMAGIVEREFEGWTVLSVVHRLEGLERFGRVLVMRDGRVK